MAPASNACSLKFFHNLNMLSPNNYRAENFTLPQEHVGLGTTFGDSWLPSWYSSVEVRSSASQAETTARWTSHGNPGAQPRQGHLEQGSPSGDCGRAGTTLHPRQRTWRKTLWWWCFDSGVVGGDGNGTNAVNKSPPLLALTRWPEPPKAPEKNQPLSKVPEVLV